MGLARKLLRVFEKVDNKPVALPVGFKKDPEADRLHMLMRKLVVDLEKRGVIPNHAESFEESLDFQLPDDEDGEVILSSVVSPSEMRYMQEEKLLQETVEASRMVMRRSEDAKLIRRYRDGDKGKVFERGDRDAARGGSDGNKERATGDGKSGNLAGGKESV